MAATQAFQSLERDVKSLVSSVQKTVAEQLPQTSGEQKKATVRLAQRELDQARDLANQLEVELRNQPSSNRSTFTTRVQGLRRQIDTLAATLSKAGQERAGSYGAVGTGYAPNTEQLHETNANLSRSNKILGGMGRRAMAHKCMTGLICLLILAILGLVMFLKLS